MVFQLIEITIRSIYMEKHILITDWLTDLILLFSIHCEYELYNYYVILLLQDLEHKLYPY